VGTGQVVNQGKSQAAAYSQLLQEASAKGDRDAMTALSALGPPPYNSDSKWAVYVKWVTAYEPGELSTWDLVSMALFDSEAGPFELRDYFRGMASSAAHFGEAIDQDDLPSLGTDFAVPFFVFQGALDHIAPVAPVKTYVERVTAPRKELVLIPNGGHNVMTLKSDEFLDLLVQRVRPLTISSP
jgi:pimeloyl-ACP methyl ester carboxylesterase